MRNFIIDVIIDILVNIDISIIIYLLAIIGIADTNNQPLVEGIKLFEFMPPGAPTKPDTSGIVFRQIWSPFKWSLNFSCALDTFSDNTNCYWFASVTNYPISKQPVRKDFVFELETEAKFREIDLYPWYRSDGINIVEVNPQILPADYTEKTKERGTLFTVLSMEVNCVREYGAVSTLWCER
ncbi:hypothetical protein ACHAPC_001322 [Botrytis cinerea]